MARRTQEQAEQTRKDILSGALAVFSEKGFSRSNLTDIAKRIGMTRGAIYWHFKNKQELLVELMDAMHEYEDSILDREVPELRSLDDLRDQFIARVELLINDKKFRKFAVLMSLQVEWATEKEIAERIRGGNLRRSPFGQILPHLKKAQENGEIRPEVDIELVEDVLIGQFIGIVRFALGGMAKKPLAASVNLGLQAVLNSIRA